MPQPTAVIQVEGVLRKPVGGAVTDAGRRLYQGLRSVYRVVLVTREARKPELESWLGMEGFSAHDHVVYGDVNVPVAREWWVTVANLLRHGYGYDPAVFVLPDPVAARALIRAGYSTLLFTQAAYALPEWRPDHKEGVRPWDELVIEVRAQQALRAADKRVNEGGESR